MIRRPGRAVGSMSSASAKVSEPSMEEILASIRRIIADDQDGGRATASSPAAPSPAAPSSDPSAQAVPTEENVLDLAGLKPARVRQRVVDLEREDMSFREGDEPLDMEDAAPDHEFDAESIGADEPPPPAPASSKPGPLLSESARATADSAFRRLSATVPASHPRTLEDAVTEMLRPMLKAWLDENLPPLVERLVRAEIERVTRGGR